MRYFLTALSFVWFYLFVGCGPQFLRNAHNYKPEPKPRIVKYWACESSEDYFWGDCNWSFGYYLYFGSKWRLVGVSWCMGSELDAGYALNAVYEDRDRYGPLTQEQLGSQPHMHCRMMSSFTAPSDQAPIGNHVDIIPGQGQSYQRVKGATFVDKDAEMSLSYVDPQDWDTETRGHEELVKYWEGRWYPVNWTEEMYIDTLGLQPNDLQHIPRQKWIPPDPPPDYNDDWHINRGQPKGIPYEELMRELERK